MRRRLRLYTTRSAPANQGTIDWTLVNDLYNTIEQNPSAIEAHELLLQQWAQAGESDAAKGVATELLQLDKNNAEARRYLKMKLSESATEAVRPMQQPKPIQQPKPTEADTFRVEDLPGKVEEIRTRAYNLGLDICLIRVLRTRDGQEYDTPKTEALTKVLKSLSQGSIKDALGAYPPRSALHVSQVIESCPDRARDIAIEDLIHYVRWKRYKERLNTDDVREALGRRVKVLDAALPEGLRTEARTALMHVEHEELHREYVNDETMYKDAVSDIPRDHFWASEDGYAWDMGELAAALSANDGVMRNPMTRQMFSASDVTCIVQHPLGKGLAALQVEQSQLFRGVRPTSIDRVETLSAILLADMSVDQIESRRSLDEFLSYSATLPVQEQEALDRLKIPAVDSHTGQPFDCTIGEAVRDVQANRVCFHKAGDLLGQAARYLRTRQG